MGVSLSSQKQQKQKSVGGQPKRKFPPPRSEHLPLPLRTMPSKSSLLLSGAHNRLSDRWNTPIASWFSRTSCPTSERSSQSRKNSRAQVDAAGIFKNSNLTITKGGYYLLKNSKNEISRRSALIKTFLYRETTVYHFRSKQE